MDDELFGNVSDSDLLEAVDTYFEKNFFNDSDTELMEEIDFPVTVKSKR